MGLFQKKTKQGREGWGHVFEKNPEIFHFFTLPLEISDKTKLHPWKFHKILLDSQIPWKFQAKNQDPWEFHIIFSWSPLEIPFCF